MLKKTKINTFQIWVREISWEQIIFCHRRASSIKCDTHQMGTKPASLAPNVRKKERKAQRKSNGGLLPEWKSGFAVNKRFSFIRYSWGPACCGVAGVNCSWMMFAAAVGHCPAWGRLFIFIKQPSRHISALSWAKKSLKNQGASVVNVPYSYKISSMMDINVLAYRVENSYLQCLDKWKINK